MQKCFSSFFVGFVSAAAAFGQAPPTPPVAANPVAATSAQPAAKPPLAVEVATVRPAGPLDPAKMASVQMRIGLKIDNAGVDIGSLPLMDVIQHAFRVKTDQISRPH